MSFVRILEEAAQETDEAAAWYDNEQPGLGDEFFDAVDAALDLIEECSLPLLPVPGKAGALGAKRIILKRFPYDVVAVERSREIIVIAIAHHARKPGYWRGRMERS
ncbi:MAG TPA: hypothetical protein VNQ97_11565 [Burkholderiaceae bacterium]|nr:hypothetical protein [Burkholderiaceae bacterium]